MIQDSSLTDMRAVTELGNTLSHVVDNMIPLAQDKKRKFLVGCDSSALSLGQFKPINDEDDEDDDYVSGVTTAAAPVGPIAPSHPLILKLSAIDSSGGEISQPLTEPRLPRYVVPLGRLLVHDMRAIDDIPSDEQPTTEIDPMDRPITLTNYAVVMDAVSKTRSIWIVYNRAPIDLEVGCQVESAPTDEDQMVLFPPGDNFDSAMVMPDVRMWRVATNLLSLDVVADHVATTKSSVPVVANPVPGDEAAGALIN